MIDVAVLGGSGYAGGDLLRLLVVHKGVNVTVVTSEQNLGRRVTEVVITSYSIHYTKLYDSAGLLAEAPHLTDAIGDGRVALILGSGLGPALADVPTDIEAGKIADGERSHRKAKIIDHLVHLLRQCAFFQ